MAQARNNDPVTLAADGATSEGAPPEDAMVSELRNWLKTPDPITSLLDNASHLREWMSSILLQDDEDTVVTHHVLRNQEAKLAHLTATKPQADFQPRKKFWGPAGQPSMPPAELVRFGETIQLLTNFFADIGKLKDAANNAARDADTVRAGWVKLIWRQDPDMTATGAMIHDDALNRVFRLKELREQFQANKFTKDDSDYLSMQRLESRIRTDIIAQLNQQIADSGVAPVQPVVAETENDLVAATSTDPLLVRVQELLSGAEITDEELMDVPRWLGFDFDLIDMEDIRLDWTIDRPEYYYLSRRIGHRTRMLMDELGQKFDLTDEQKDTLRSSHTAGKAPTSTESADVGEKHSESSDDVPNNPTSGLWDNHYDVWEVWDREDGTVYVFVEGLRQLLHSYTPRATGPQWFPFFYLWFHEMAGHIYAPSSVELQRPIQHEINSIRSHGIEYRKAVMPRLLIGKDAMSEEEIDRFENSHPLQVIEVERPDDIKASLFRFDGITYNPALVSTHEAFMDLQLLAGMPTAGLGGVGNAKLATEVAFAGEQLETQIDRQKYLFNDFLTRIFREMAYIIVRALPYENAVAIAGPGIEFPLGPEDREAYLVDLHLDVATSPTGVPNTTEKLSHLQTVMTMLQAQGIQVNALWAAERIGEALGIETDAQSMVQAQGPLPGVRPQDAPTDAPATGAPSGPAPGTPTGGLDSTPAVDELPGG